MEANPQVGFIDAVKLAFKNYINFNGRSRRSEFWWFYLFNFIIGFILYFLVLVVNQFFIYLLLLYWLIIFLPI